MLALPERLTELPERLTALPECLAALPDSLSALPDDFCALPDDLLALPEHLKLSSGPPFECIMHLDRDVARGCTVLTVETSSQPCLKCLIVCWFIGPGATSRLKACTVLTTDATTRSVVWLLNRLHPRRREDKPCGDECNVTMSLLNTYLWSVRSLTVAAGSLGNCGRSEKAALAKLAL